MKLFSANLASLPDLYTAELARALDMEEALTRSLPRMVQKANDPQLKQTFHTHLIETHKHVMRLKRLLRDQGSKTCKVIRALISEAEDTISDASGAQATDIALIGAVQRVEHYEIAVYGTLKAWARKLGRVSDFEILNGIEADEKNADTLLSSISDRVNTGPTAIAA